MRKYKLKLIPGLLLTFLLFACEKGPQVPAPIGEHAVLQQLADAFNEVALNYPMQPQSMPPKGRKVFIERVFLKAGYEYTATLLAVAKNDVKIINKDQRDLVELLFLPHKGLPQADLSHVYSEEEVTAVQVIQANMP